MIAPYTVGPMQLSGLAWYQGEQNTPKKDNTTVYAAYGCMFKALIQSWRSVLHQPSLYFGFVCLCTQLCLYGRLSLSLSLYLSLSLTAHLPP